MFHLLLFVLLHNITMQKIKRSCKDKKCHLVTIICLATYWLKLSYLITLIRPFLNASVIVGHAAFVGFLWLINVRHKIWSLHLPRNTMPASHRSFAGVRPKDAHKS